MFVFRIIRHSKRSNSTITFIIVTVCSFLFTVYLYRQRSTRNIPSSIIVKSDTLVSSIAVTTEKNISTEQPVHKQESSKTIETNAFDKYSSDEHLLSLLTQYSNTFKQVIITIIGGDSYSLFAWDWYERMYEISNITNKCHCFVVAMDEIAVILAVKQGVPVYYSTFTFEQQMNWINSIEARQHSLYRVGHAK
ncbi:unnamed protein product, partial [Adineta steineri]